VLLGGGERLFDAIGDRPRMLAIRRVVPSAVAAHIAFALKTPEAGIGRRTELALLMHSGGSGYSEATAENS
jgi:hypothetical protein